MARLVAFFGNEEAGIAHLRYMQDQMNSNIVINGWGKRGKRGVKKRGQPTR